MKSLNGLKLLLPLLIVAFAFISCDTDENPVGTLEEIAGRIPNVEVIPNADNATMHKRNDQQYSLFSVDVSGIGFNNNVSDGTYFGWCADMTKPRGTDRDISGTTLFRTDKDEIFNQLSYIVNNRRSYEEQFSGMSWKDIQVAMWVILETADYNLASIRDNIPSFVEGFNEEYVNGIVADVKQNGTDFIPGFGDTKLILMDANDPGQPPLIEVKCETALARMYDNPNNFTYEWSGNSVWFTYLIHKPTSDAKTFYLYAAQTFRVGEVDIWKDEDDLYVEIIIKNEDDLDDLFIISESHLDIQLNADEYEPPVKAGNWPYNGFLTQSNDQLHIYKVPWESEWDDIDLYIAVHAVVCGAVEEWQDE